MGSLGTHVCAHRLLVQEWPNALRPAPERRPERRWHELAQPRQTSGPSYVQSGPACRSDVQPEVLAVGLWWWHAVWCDYNDFLIRSRAGRDYRVRSKQGKKR